MDDSSIDWSIFDKQYPVRDGIVIALPPELNYDVEPDQDAKHFFDVHSEILKEHQGKDFLGDKSSMAQLQKDFYDRMAVGFQQMDDSDKSSGGVFWWKIYRIADCDEHHFKKTKLLFIGAGNCRLARIFASLGYDVVATDISFNMLKIGKEINDKMGIRMTYVAHNAEVQFPFKSEQFDTSYSLCVINHIVDWRNYISEKMRCLRKGGVLLERMPNATLWDFWKKQGELYEGVEMKAKYCTPDAAKVALAELGLRGNVWTHDRQTEMVARIDYYIPKRFRLKLSKAWYGLRTWWEDNVRLHVHDDEAGIYTMFKVVKES